jgi:hypothetical protein
LNFEYDTVVLGSSFEAILFAAQNFFPVIFSDLRKPFRFDYMSPEADISCFNFPAELRSRTLNTFNGKIQVGVAKYLLWERMLFLLSMEGNVPLSNLCRSIRLEDNKITCFNNYSKIAQINFNTCFYFGDNNISNINSQKTLDNTDYVCYDWIAFNRGGKHEIDFFETNDNFVKRVWFYPSDRIDGNTSVKDACVVSILNEEQILNFDFSETMSRFKLVSEMEQRGMRGLFNGYNTNNRPLYYKFKTSHLWRDKQAIAPKYKTQDIKGIKILSEKQRKGLYKNLPKIHMVYNRFLRDTS